MLQLRVHMPQLKILHATAKRSLMLQDKKRKKKEPISHTMTWCSQINKLIIITIKLGSAQLCPGPTESESGGLRGVRELVF